MVKFFYRYAASGEVTGIFVPEGLDSFKRIITPFVTIIHTLTAPFFFSFWLVVYRKLKFFVGQRQVARQTADISAKDFGNGTHFF